MNSQGEKFVQSRFKDKAAIVLWHYNYDTQIMTFIDADLVVWDIVADENLSFRQNNELRDTLSLG